MNERILVVEDNNELRSLIEMTLNLEGYQVSSSENGKEALLLCAQALPDLIISDIAMPEMDGFTFLKKIRSQEKGKGLPFLFLSAYSQKEDLRRASHLAVDDYIVKPFDARELLDAVRVRLDRRRSMQIFDTREAHFQTVLLMANVIETRDYCTRGHIDRVCDLALRLGEALGLGKSTLVILEFGAILHDIGKLVVPAKVLNKPGKLTPKEWQSIYQHPGEGAKMLREVEHLKSAIPYVLAHHEKWDGSGYPYGLKKENIPFEGRMMAIVDFYDALTNDRSYHKKCSSEEVLELIKEKSGIYFDPDLVQEFLAISGNLL